MCDHEIRKENASKSPVRCTKIKIFPADSYPLGNVLCFQETDQPKTTAKDANPSQQQLEESHKPWNKEDGLYQEQSTKLYKRRFWMLFLMCVCTMMNGLQWIQYSIISNILECYHGVDAYMVNWTSTIFMVMYLVLVLPASWFIGRFDIKVSLVTGSFLNCLCTSIQCASLGRDGFPILLTGQAVAAVGQVVILPVVPRLAALWFGAGEVGRASAVGVLGNQFGVAIGFLLPPLVVSNDCSNPSLIKYGRSILAYSFCVTNLINFFLLITTFKTKPPIPPSESSKTPTQPDYKKSLVNLMKNFNFLKLLLTYGLLTGVCMAIGTLLNQMLAPLFQDSETVIGWIGISTNFLGLISAYFAGYVLDATHKYKETSLVICIVGLASLVAVTGLLYVRHIAVQFITVLLSGVILNCYFSVGLDFAAEITYPEPQGTTAGILNAATMISGTVIIMISSYLLQTHGIISACLVFCGVVLLSCVTAGLVDADYRRQQKNAESVANVVVLDSQSLPNTKAAT